MPCKRQFWKIIINIILLTVRQIVFIKFKNLQDGVLLALKEPFLTDGDGEVEQAEEDESNPYLVVHPNYTVDE